MKTDVHYCDPFKRYCLKHKDSFTETIRAKKVHSGKNKYFDYGKALDQNSIQLYHHTLNLQNIISVTQIQKNKNK